jgi:hypothetical protein
VLVSLQANASAGVAACVSVLASVWLAWLRKAGSRTRISFGSCVGDSACVIMVGSCECGSAGSSGGGGWRVWWCS